MFNSINLNLLQKSLDGLWMKQQTVMNNIANYSTPGYKSTYVDFETALRNSLDNYDGNNISDTIEDIWDSEIVTGQNDNLTMRQDGNNVDIEKENMELVRAQLNYYFNVSQLNSYFKRLNMVIWEGKK